MNANFWLVLNKAVLCIAFDHVILQTNQLVDSAVFLPGDPSSPARPGSPGAPGNPRSPLYRSRT